MENNNITEEEKIEIAKKEFDDKSASLKTLIDFANEREAKFLKIKIGFTTFIGVVFSIIFSQEDKFEMDFGINFFSFFVFIVLINFMLLFHELWSEFLDSEESVKKQGKKTVLCNIRYDAVINQDESLKKEFDDYGRRAEELLNQDNAVLQSMHNKESITEIINKMSMVGKWRLNFCLWLFIFLSIPILFLLKIMGILK